MKTILARHDDNVIAGFVAWRHGAVVGTGDARELAWQDAAANGVARAEVWPANAWLLEKARDALRRRTWMSELELLQELLACAIEGIDADWPWTPEDDDARDARFAAISDELVEAELRADASTARVPAPGHETRRAVERNPGELFYADFPMRGGGSGPC